MNKTKPRRSFILWVNQTTDQTRVGALKDPNLEPVFVIQDLKTGQLHEFKTREELLTYLEQPWERGLR
jgi:hypothetical protein